MSMLTLTCAQCGTHAAQNLFLGGCLRCQLLGGTDEPGGGLSRLYQHFEILQRPDGALWELGQGAMGITYKALDTTLQVPVALKVIHARFSSRESVRSSFLREARTAAQLVHPNIARVFHFGTITAPADATEFPLNEGDCFYAMEFVAGETLEARLKRTGLLKPDLALAIAVEVARALAAGEKQGLVHCDLKPSNIMLARETADGGHGDAWVKVIDFGVARAVSEAFEVTSSRPGFSGTPCFASPEQLAGETPDVRSDIFSLGVTLWLALTGELPYPGRTVEEIRQQHQAQALPLPQLEAVSCPAPFREILVAMLAPDKTRRPASAGSLLQKLTACAAGANEPERGDRLLTRDHEAFQLFRSAQDAVHSSSPSRERYEDAIQLLERATGRDPEFAQAHAMLAEMHALMFRHSHERSPARAQSVITAVETALRLSPASGEGLRARGIYHYHILNDYDRARLDFQAALRVLPNDADSLLGLGLADSRQNRWEEAVASFRLAAELNPYRAEYANQWWRTLEAMRRYPEARAVLDQMIARHPENLRIRLNRAFLSYSGEADLGPLQEFLDSVPPDYDPDGVITFMRWSVARYQGDPDTAERVLSTSARTHFSGHVDGQIYPRATLDLLIALDRGDHEKSGRMAAAQLPMLRGLVQKMPNSPGPLMLLAACQAISSEIGDAVELGQRALATLPPEKDGIDGPKLAVQMVWIYILAGQHDQAIDLLEKYAPQPGFMNYGEFSWGITYRPLRSHPKFPFILSRLALPR